MDVDKFLADARKGWEKAEFTTGVYWRDRTLKECKIYDIRQKGEDVCYACAIGAAALANKMNPIHYLNAEGISRSDVSRIAAANDASATKEGAIARIRLEYMKG
jgi:hypothetical protein